MQVTGTVEIYDIDNNSTSLSSRHGTLILGTEDGEVILLHRYSANKTGVKYRLTNNIEKVFSKFSCQGKATIRLLNPHQDVKIRGSDDCLEEFVKLVKEVAEGNKTNIRPIPPNCTMEGPRRTGAVVSSTAELSKLPKMIVSLSVKGCNLETLHPEIMRFEDLRILDLSYNSLVDLPATLGRLSLLTVLVLNNNSFGCKTDWKFLESHVLRDTLRVLDLQYNNITVLPNEVTMLHNLEKLMVNHNMLKTLPYGIGKMGLIELGLSYNQIQYFPTTLIQLGKLQILDISHNPPLDMDSLIPRTIDNNAPSLIECSLKALEYRFGAPEHLRKLYYPPFTLHRMSEIEFASRTMPISEIEINVRRICLQLRYDSRMYSHYFNKLPNNLQKILRSAKQCYQCTKHVYEQYTSCFRSRIYPSVMNLVRSEDMDETGIIMEIIYCSDRCRAKHNSGMFNVH